MLVFKKAVFLGVPGGARDYGRVREGLTTNRGVAKPRNIIVVMWGRETAARKVGTIT